MSKYQPSEFVGNMNRVMDALPTKQAVAAAIDYIEGIRLTVEEVAYLAKVLAHKQSRKHEPMLDEERLDICYNDCDSEFGKGMKRARFTLTREIVGAL